MSKFYGAILEPYADDEDYENFLYDLGYFEKYLGKEVFVQGNNLDWRGSCGEMTFILEDIKQVFEKLVHQDTDFSFEILKSKEPNTYRARSSNHDCNSKFILTFSEPKEDE
jgi:hypothetical protein